MRVRSDLDTMTIGDEALVTQQRDPWLNEREPIPYIWSSCPFGERVASLMESSTFFTEWE